MEAVRQMMLILTFMELVIGFSFLGFMWEDLVSADLIGRPGIEKIPGFGLD